jgi:hypothetical protein
MLSHSVFGHKTQARGFGQGYRTGISNTQIYATAEKSLPNTCSTCIKWLRDCGILYKKNFDYIINPVLTE